METNEILYKVFNSCAGDDEELGYGRCLIDQMNKYNGKEISMAFKKEG